MRIGYWDTHLARLLCVSQYSMSGYWDFYACQYSMTHISPDFYACPNILCPNILRFAFRAASLRRDPIDPNLMHDFWFALGERTVGFRALDQCPFARIFQVSQVLAKALLLVQLVS